MKKKLLSIILIVALVLAIGVAVTACKQTKGLDAAAESFSKVHKTTEFDKASMELPASYVYEGVTYQVEWTASINNVNFAKADGKVTLTATRTTEVQSYTLIATLKDADGNAKAVDFRATVPANPNAGGEYGEAFYLYMDQQNLNKIQWLKNSISSSIAAIETSNKKEDAVEYYFEDVDGQQGKKLFFLEGTTKKYIDAVADGQYYNVAIATSTNVLWTVNADNVIVTTIGEKELFLGTNGTYFTATIKETKDLSKSFPVKKAGLDDNIAVTAVTTVSGLIENCTVTITEPAPVNGKVVTTIGATIKFTVTPDTGCTIDSVKLAGKTITAQDGVYTATVEKTGAITVEATNPNAREENLTKRLTINASLPVVNTDKTESVITSDGVTITNKKNESTTPCYSGAAINSARFYKDSSLKIECEGMLRVVISMDSGFGAEGFEGVQITGAKVLADGTTAIIIFEEAAVELNIAKLAAQIRVNQIDIYTAEAGSIQIKPAHAGTEADPYTAYDALLQAKEVLALESSKYSQDKYWAAAYVVSVKTATVNGSTVYDVDLADEAGGTKQFSLYHGNLDGTTVPYVGDKVLIVGHLTRYNSTYQFGGGTNAYPDGTSGVFATVKVLETANGSIKEAGGGNEHVTVTITGANDQGILVAKNGTKVTFTVTVDDGYNLDSVKVNNVAATETATEGIYEVILSGDMEIVIKTTADTEKSETLVFANLASANSWENGTAYGTTDADLISMTSATLKAAGGGNNGKYYTSNSSWRFYTGGGELVIAAKAGYTIKSVTINTTSKCAMTLNGTAITNGTTYTVTGNSITFVATGTTEIQSIVIVYEKIATE